MVSLEEGQFVSYNFSSWREVSELQATEDGSLGVFIAIRYTERVSPYIDRDLLIRTLAPLVGPGLEHTMLTYGQKLDKQGYDRGRRDGHSDGRKDGQRALLLRQLTRRFGALPPDVATRVEQASPDQLEHWGDRILDATSLDDVFAA